MTDKEHRALIAGSHVAIYEIMHLLYSKKIFDDSDWSYVAGRLEEVYSEENVAEDQKYSLKALAGLLRKHHPSLEA